MTVRWVKGHKDLRDCTSEEDRRDSVANAKVDHWAGRAREEACGSLARVVAYANRRSEAYSGFMLKVHRCMIATIRASPRGQEARGKTMPVTRRFIAFPGTAMRLPGGSARKPLPALTLKPGLSALLTTFKL